MGKFGDSRSHKSRLLGKVGKEARFPKSDPLYKLNVNPGPNDYNLTSYQSVRSSSTDKRRKLATGACGREFRSTFGSKFFIISTIASFMKTSPAYFKENEKIFIGKATPGPNRYSPEKSFELRQTKISFSFPKNDRRISVLCCVTVK